MKKMILTLSSFLFLTNLSFADQTITANMKYFVNNGSKIFSAQSFPESEYAVVQMGLAWDNYNDSVKEGFNLSKAEGKKIISPYLPARCSIINIQGSLNWMKNGTSPIGISLKGKDCDQFINDLKNSPLEMEFTNVPHQANSQIIQNLIVKIVELP